MSDLLTTEEYKAIAAELTPVTQAFIDGSFRPAKTAGTFDSINPATGKIIAKNAAETVKRTALELGGKNPNVIFADADFDVAVDNALNGAFFHSGQVCSAGSRIVVEEPTAGRRRHGVTRPGVRTTE